MPPTLAQAWTQWEKAALNDGYPFTVAPYADTKRAMEKVIPLFGRDQDAFTREFAAAAEPYERAAREAEARGEDAAARENYLKAYGLYRMARFPCMSTPGKKAAYLKSQECVLAAARYDEIPPERIEMPFRGRAGEGGAVVGYLRRPKKAGRPPVLIAWGGVDTFKEETLHRAMPFFKAGMAVMAVELPGTGDAPVLGSEDAERQWDAMFDWIAAQPDLDSRPRRRLGRQLRRILGDQGRAHPCRSLPRRDQPRRRGASRVHAGTDRIDPGKRHPLGPVRIARPFLRQAEP